MKVCKLYLSIMKQWVPLWALIFFFYVIVKQEQKWEVHMFTGLGSSTTITVSSRRSMFWFSKPYAFSNGKTELTNAGGISLVMVNAGKNCSKNKKGNKWATAQITEELSVKAKHLHKNILERCISRWKNMSKAEKVLVSKSELKLSFPHFIQLSILTFQMKWK